MTHEAIRYEDGNPHESHDWGAYAESLVMPGKFVCRRCLCDIEDDEALEVCAMTHEAEGVRERVSVLVEEYEQHIDHEREAGREPDRAGFADRILAALAPTGIEGWATNDPHPGTVIFYHGEEGAEIAPVTSTPAILTILPTPPESNEEGE